MKLAISGASGFLGREAIDYLSADPKLTIHALCSSTAQPLAEVDGLKVFSGSLADSKTVKEWLSGCDAVLHLAERGMPSQVVERPDTQITRNITNAVCLTSAMRDLGIKNMIYASSGGALYEGVSREGDRLNEKSPISLRNPYAISKYFVEQHCERLNHEESWNISILRISNPYGIHQIGRTRQGIIGLAIEKIYFGKGIPLWVSQKTAKDFLYVTDLCRAFELFSKKPTAGVFNIGSGQSTTLETLFRNLEKITGRKPNICTTPKPLNEPQITALDCLKAKTAVGWECSVSLESGLVQLWDWRCKKAPLTRAA